MRTRGGGRFFRPRTPSKPEQGRSRGQSLVEFTLILPVFLLILLFAVDFGRAFYSWVTVTNASRVAANYAALNPGADFATDTTYRDLVVNDALNAICPVTAPPTAAPGLEFYDTNSNGTTKSLGDKVTVRISCDFGVLTPVISTVIGSPVKIGASSTFIIRTGPYLP